MGLPFIEVLRAAFPKTSLSRKLNRSCPICGSNTDTSEDAFCSSHGKAFVNIQSAFPVWKRAYGSLTYPQFLERLSKLPRAGIRTREVAKFLLLHYGDENVEDPYRL